MTISPKPITPKKVTRNGKPKYQTIIYGTDGQSRIPSFNEVQISTMTIIASTNLLINTDKFYKYIPVTDYTIVKKKRGRKRKIQPEDPNKDIPPGSIISLTKKRCFRGVILKQKRKQSKTYFRHSVSVVMILDDGKMLNVKVSSNGKLQMTGCKTIKHAVEFIKHMYSLMIESEEWTGETLFTYRTPETEMLFDNDNTDSFIEDNPQDIQETEPELNRDDNHGLTAMFRVAMKNIDFELGYRIRRDKLNSYINKYTDFRSIFESSVGPQVNIKIRAMNHFDTHLNRLRITAEGECIEDNIPYETFFKNLTPKEQKDEKKKEAYHTFLVFASGSVIMSSAGQEMPIIFYKLVSLLIENRNSIEEKDNFAKIFDTSWLEDNM